MIAELELPNNPNGDHVQWLADWRNARNAACTVADGTPEETALYQQTEDLSIALCQTPATSPEGLVAQLEWLQEDLGGHIEGTAGPEHNAVFSVLKQSVRNLSK